MDWENELSKKVLFFSCNEYKKNYDKKNHFIFITKKMTDQLAKIALFEQKQIRRIWNEEERYFSVVDVVEALTNSPEPRKYRSVLKLRMQSESNIEPTTICSQLKMTAKD
jgi:hypothetical protein